MGEDNINRNHFIVEFFWMSELGIKGNELRVYALIYSYSQDNQGVYFGSIDYLRRRLLISRPQLFRILSKLVDLNLIKKNETYQNNVKLVSYEIVENKYTSLKMIPPVSKGDGGGKEMIQGEVSKGDGGSLKMIPNNKVYNKEEYNKVIEKDLLEKLDLLEKIDRDCLVEDKIIFDRHHVLTRYLINAEYLTKNDKSQYYRYDRYFEKFIGENGYEFEDYKLFVQYFVYRHMERIKNKKYEDKPLKNKFGYFITAMEKARWEFSDRKG